MEQKIKIAVIGLVGLLLVSLVVILGISGAKNALSRQVVRLNSENTSLRKQVDDIALEKRQIEDQINTLSDRLTQLTAEKDELQKRYEAVDKTREALIEKLKIAHDQAKKVEVVQPVEQAPVTSKTEDAYWGGVLKSKAELEVQLASLRSEIDNLNINSEQLQKEKAASELEITSLIRDKQDLKRQLDYNQRIIDSISAELAREKSDKIQILETLSPFKSENAQLRRQVKGLNNRKAALEKRLAEFREKNETLENRFAEVGVLLKDKMLQIGGISKQLDSPQKEPAAPLEQKKLSVDLPEIVVHSQASNSTEDRPAFTGRILAINRENNFAVLDVGESYDVKIGDTFEVYSGGKVTAVLEAIQVRESISACDIKKEFKPIKVGDTIRRQ